MLRARDHARMLSRTLRVGGLGSRTPEIDRRTFLKLTGATAVIAACGGAGTTTASPSFSPGASGGVPATPKPTGRISIYSALNDSTNNELFGAFQKATGIGFDVLPLAAAGELQTRITTEKNSPKADVFVGGSSEFHDPLGKQGLLEAYKSPNAVDLDAQYKDPNGMWTGWYLGIFGFVLNTDRFAKELKDSKKPTSWDDLLNSAWKGHLTLPDPVKTGGGYIYIATQIFRFAAEAMAASPSAEQYAA